MCLLRGTDCLPIRYSFVLKVLMNRLIVGQIETLKNDIFWHAQLCVCVCACVLNGIKNCALIDVAADGVVSLANLALILPAACMIFTHEAQNCTAPPMCFLVCFKASGNCSAGLCFRPDYTSTVLTAPLDGGPRGRVQCSSLILKHAGLGNG